MALRPRPGGSGPGFRISPIPGLVTRGFVADTHVTRGMSKCKTKRIAILVELERIAQLGRRSYKRTLNKILVAAKLIKVNDCEPDPQVVGSDMVNFYTEDARSKARAVAKVVDTSVRKLSEGIVIRVGSILKRDSDGDD